MFIVLVPTQILRMIRGEKSQLSRTWKQTLVTERIGVCWVFQLQADCISGKKKIKKNVVQQSMMEASECFLKQAGHFSKAVIEDNRTSELSVGHGYVPFTLADQIACHRR